MEFEPERAKHSLPKLLRTNEERRHAHALLDRAETDTALDEHQRRLVTELRALLPVTASRKSAKRAAAPKRKPVSARPAARRR